MKKLNLFTIMLGLFEYRGSPYLRTFATGLCFFLPFKTLSEVKSWHRHFLHKFSYQVLYLIANNL